MDRLSCKPLARTLVLFSIFPSAWATTTHAASSYDHKIKTVYIIPSSHWDLGFKLPPEEQLDDIKPHLDSVIRVAKQDPQFRWVIESTWQLSAWLERTHDPKQVQDLIDLVKNGQIELSAVFGSEHTEFMGTEQLNRLAYDIKGIQKRLGVTTDFAMMDDVPGFSLRIPQVLARSGVKYFLTGSNLYFGGGTSLHPGKMPFHWESPDGSTVLTWETGSKNGGYTEAMSDYYMDPTFHYYSDPSDSRFYPKAWKGLRPLEIMQRGMDKFLAEYDRAHYPYDAALMMYVHDFIPPEDEENGLLPAVRAWNAAGKQPKIIVALPSEFFKYMESKYGNRFGTYAGDFSGLWAETKTNSPGISADARWVQDHSPQSELLWSFLTFRKGTTFPQATLDDARFKMLKYDEHSGAGQPGWPKIMTLAQVNKQNSEYAGYTKTSKAEITRLLTSGMADLFAQVKDADANNEFVIFNPLSWQRSELVHMRPPSAEMTQVRDLATNAIVPTQLTATGELEFMARDVPSVGYRTYALERAGHPAPTPELSGTMTADSKFYTVTTRESDGSITSIYDKQLNRELVQSQSPKKFGEMVSWNASQYLPLAVSKAAIHHMRGPLSDELIVLRAGSYWPLTRIVLPQEEKTVQIDNVFDRSKMPLVPFSQNGQLYGFEFPFLFTGSSNILVDNGTGFHRMPQDYLPGALTYAVVPQHTLSFTSTEDTPSFSINLLQRQGFFDTLLRFPGSAGQLGPFLNEVRLTAIRKSDMGDMKDKGIVTLPTVEPGYGPLYTSSVAVTSSAGFDAVKSYKDGWDFNFPLLISTLAGGWRPREPTASMLSLSAPNVVVLAFKPSTDGNKNHYTVRLQEVAGKNTKVALTTLFKVASIVETSMTEDVVINPKVDQSQINIAPHETMTLRLDIPHGTNDWQAEGMY